jgi:hypothetical protein
VIDLDIALAAQRRRRPEKCSYQDVIWRCKFSGTDCTAPSRRRPCRLNTAHDLHGGRVNGLPPLHAGRRWPSLCRCECFHPTYRSSHAHHGIDSTSRRTWSEPASTVRPNDIGLTSDLIPSGPHAGRDAIWPRAHHCKSKPCCKFATSPANRHGSWPAFTRANQRTPLAQDRLALRQLKRPSWGRSI